MADLIELLHNLARQRGRGEQPLVLMRAFPARSGARISHLALDDDLAQAWVKLTGAPFYQHQARALAALNRYDAPLALVGGPSAHQSLYLLLLQQLRSQPDTTALLVAPDETAAAAHLAALHQIAQMLRHPLRLGAAWEPANRAALGANLVVTTPIALHGRLLRRHDRAWVGLWSRLGLFALAEAHTYNGVAAVHLAAMLLRARRLTPQSLRFVATFVPMAGAPAALASLAGVAWRIIAADDLPVPATSLALWRVTGPRLREAAALALEFAGNGVRVHLTCAPYEAPVLRSLLGADVPTVSVGPSPLPARVQILLGLTEATPWLAHTLDGAGLIVLLLGDEPAERNMLRLAIEQPEQLPLFDGQPPTWVVAPSNAYAEAAQLLCAASERPLTANEIELWHAVALVPRLEKQGQLICLPGDEQSWQPAPARDDPYVSLDPRAASGPSALLRDEQGQLLGELDLASFDRWGFVGAVLPPGRGGLRVLARDDETLTLTLRTTPETRRTLPLRRCTVTLRTTHEQRTLHGHQVAWGRVMIEEEVYAYRETVATLGAAPTERTLSVPLNGRWSATAVWLDLPIPVSAAGQLAGWLLVAALPLRIYGDRAGLTPAYDSAKGRLYLVDSQPGGSGLAQWLYTNLDDLLPLAYDIARDSRNDPLFEPLARSDMDWLLALLGGGSGSSWLDPVPRPATTAPVAPSQTQREREAAVQREREQREREAAAQREREAAAQREREAAVQREREQREREAVAQREREQREREAAAQREREAAAQREREQREREAVAQREREQREREAAAQREREQREREAAAQREREAAAQREREAAAQREREQREHEAPSHRKREAGRRGRNVPSHDDRLTPLPLPPIPEVSSELPFHESLLRPPHATESGLARDEANILPDAAAMIERLRRLREQRERQTGQGSHPSDPGLAQSEATPAEPRFRVGDQIVCTPYGEGQVLNSRIVRDREILEVKFAAHGRLTIDAALNMARLRTTDAPLDDDPPF